VQFFLRHGVVYLFLLLLCASAFLGRFCTSHLVKIFKILRENFYLQKLSLGLQYEILSVA